MSMQQFHLNWPVRQTSLPDPDTTKFRATAQLTIPILKIPIHLGLHEDERKKEQEITVRIEIQYQNLPLACHSDKITETLCYHTVWNRIAERVTNKPHKLIERVSQLIVDEVAILLIENKLNPASVYLELHKPQLPMGGLPEGVYFAVREFVE